MQNIALEGEGDVRTAETGESADAPILIRSQELSAELAYNSQEDDNEDVFENEHEHIGSGEDSENIENISLFLRRNNTVI